MQFQDHESKLFKIKIGFRDERSNFGTRGLGQGRGSVLGGQSQVSRWGQRLSFEVRDDVRMRVRIGFESKVEVKF